MIEPCGKCWGTKENCFCPSPPSIDVASVKARLLASKSPAPGENAEAEDVEAAVYERSKQFYWPKVEDAEPKPMSAEELERERQIQAEVIQPDRTRLRLLATIDALKAEIERLQMDGIHTCSSQCRRTACVLRREIDALKARAEAAEARVRELERERDIIKRAHEDNLTLWQVREKQFVTVKEADLIDKVTRLTEALEKIADYGPPHDEPQDTACWFCDMGGAGYSSKGEGHHDDECPILAAQKALAAVKGDRG